jgi:hypothetical protein
MVEFGWNRDKNIYSMYEFPNRRLNSGNASYNSDRLSSCLLSKNINIRIYKTIILPVVLHVCETWSLTVEHGLRVFENRVLRTISGPRDTK